MLRQFWHVRAVRTASIPAVVCTLVSVEEAYSPGGMLPVLIFLVVAVFVAGWFLTSLVRCCYCLIAGRTDARQRALATIVMLPLSWVGLMSGVYIRLAVMLPFIITDTYTYEQPIYYDWGSSASWALDGPQERMLVYDTTGRMDRVASKGEAADGTSSSARRLVWHYYLYVYGAY